TAPEVLRGFIAAFLDWAQANPVEAKVHLFEVLGVSSRVDELYRSYARSIGEELVDRLTAVSCGPALTAGNRRILGDVLVGALVQIVVDRRIIEYEPPRAQLLADIDGTLGWAMAAGMAALGFG